MKKPRLISCAACLLAACLCSALLAGCKAAPATQVDVTFFSLVDSDGWTPPGLYTIEQDGAGDPCLSWHPAYLEAPRMAPMSRALQDELWALLQRHALWRWDGFDKSIDAFDAPGFSLKIEFADGTSIEAHGYGTFPKGYEKARDDLAAFFEAAVS